MGKAVSLRVEDISYSMIDDRNIIRFIEAVRKGIPFSKFIHFSKNTPFSMGEWSTYLNMSERTLQRYKSGKKNFDPIYAEKILQISLLYNLGMEIFGNREKLNTWLETHNLALGGARPKELLDSSFGIGLLRDELNRIEQGVLA